MVKFTTIMGSPCTGKTTKFNEVFELVSDQYYPEPVIHRFFNKKKGSEIEKQVGFYFAEPNLMFIGSHNKRGQLQGLDVITNSGGMNMDTFDEFLKHNSDKNVFTEANYSFSPGRKLPNNIHSLGFDQCNWVLLKHPNREVLEERKIDRAEGTGRTPSQKSLDAAWRDNLAANRLLQRYRDEASSEDSIRCYKSTTEYLLTLEDLT